MLVKLSKTEDRAKKNLFSGMVWGGLYLTQDLLCIILKAI